MEPSWEPFDVLGASERRKREIAKNLEKTNENQRFWLLGASLGGLLGRLRGLRELSWAIFGPSWEFPSYPCASWNARGASWALLGAFSGPFATFIGGSGVVFRPSWAILRLSPGPRGPSWSRFGRRWAVLERRNSEKARRPKTSKKLMKINDVGLLGLSWEASWDAFGASWSSLGTSSGLPGHS